MDVIYREEVDRWVRGDRYIRPFLRNMLRRKRLYSSGMRLVVRNFLTGLNRKKIDYCFNRSFFTIRKSEKVISFGLGTSGVNGLPRSTAIIAAIGFPYPGDLPELCNEYNIKKYLQHSKWVLDLAKSADVYDNEIFELWPAGIDVSDWKPIEDASRKEVDVLIYNKIYWDKDNTNRELVQPIRDFLNLNNYSFSEITYGNYSKEDYQKKLSQAKVMIFLSAHESQGLAYQECLASNVPVIAWDQGYWLDPIRYKYSRPVVRSTSVPFFDERCGKTFNHIDEFIQKFESFFEDSLSGKFNPREFVLEKLSIEKSTDRMLEIYNSI